MQQAVGEPTECCGGSDSSMEFGRWKLDGGGRGLRAAADCWTTGRAPGLSASPAENNSTDDQPRIGAHRHQRWTDCGWGPPAGGSHGNASASPLALPVALRAAENGSAWSTRSGRLEAAGMESRRGAAVPGERAGSRFMGLESCSVERQELERGRGVESLTLGRWLG